MRLDSAGDEALPAFAPALAMEAPIPNADSSVWSVPLRQGVTFHDGTPFDGADVVATYNAVLDPGSASEIASAFAMIAEVSSSRTATGETVTFTLAYPYADFPSRLLLAIAPSERLTGGPAAESSLNREPVGTGPYRLSELTADRAVFTANPHYWAGPPQVSKVTTVYLPDDNSRVQRVAAGEFDGTILPPALARTFTSKPGFGIESAHSADWRGVSLPADVAFTRDPQVRLALNHAVDRQAMVDTVLAGYGEVAHTPVSAVYGDAFDPAAVFPYDVDKARSLLAGAGWSPGPDGVLVKGTDRAAFTVAFRPTDSVRRDLATAFAADMMRVGVEVTLAGLDFDKIEPRVRDLGILLGGGDKPFSLDTQVYAALHSPLPGTALWDNPGQFSTPARDAALDQARRTLDPERRTSLYRQVQADYLTDPSYVFLVFLEHTYAVRDSTWQRAPVTIEPHSHGVNWGPWWNVASWTR
ncbi:ABC transporter substrate-binding protein [Propioniciclava coleopterorum]|uniref:ABC transporter substrate-binding protein n=1 Tax=Propioniciclava coleopterorum TaxID=2714937 RepID=UPI00197DA8B8|nr:ABC transporter substrate-binding protein [Propioniciclava coleopterorum]